MKAKGKASEPTRGWRQHFDPVPSKQVDGTMKLVVGLGNPGKQYDDTRHNVGFAVLWQLAKDALNPTAKDRFHGQFAEIQLANERLGLLWPHTFMNRSGQAVQAAVAFYKIELDELLVVCDDFNLPLGKLRMRAGGTSGGQKGLESIIASLGSNEFTRLRLGIGPVPPRWDPADFVLGRFAVDERSEADAMVIRAAEAIRTWSIDGVASAMNQFNSSRDESTENP